MCEIKFGNGKIADNVKIGKNVKINAKNLIIEEGVEILDYTEIVGEDIVISRDVKIGDGVEIRSCHINISEKTRIDSHAKITAYEKFSVGRCSIIRKNALFKARAIEIGEFFYSDDNPIPLIIGGGGSDRPTARIKIGKRCVIHDSFINVCMPVELGDNVGMSPGSAIITHGFWNPVIEGYSSEFAPVRIGNNVIIGYRALILPGVTLGNFCSVGAGAVVTKSFPDYCVIGGVPAKIIKTKPDYPKYLTIENKKEIVEKILYEYSTLLEDRVDEVKYSKDDSCTIIYGKHNNTEFEIIFSLSIKEIEQNLADSSIRKIILSFDDCEATEKDFVINLRDYSWKGSDDEISDDLRDFLRHYGIRIFSRHFRSLPPKIKKKLFI
ncbi:MAG: DapH/DapD/GlmU-related protein [Thermoplasmata archaeon]